MCDCDYVLLYYFDLVIRSAGSEHIFFGDMVSVCLCVFARMVFSVCMRAFLRISVCVFGM